MKASIATALGIAALLAVAGVAGYAVVSHDALLPSSGTANGGSMGTLDVYVKDAPANWSHVYVTFDRVAVQAADQGNESGWHNMTVSKTVDLAALTTVSALLGSEQLPAGMYTQVRLNVTGVVGVMANGTQVSFTVPSGELRTDQPFNITGGRTTGLTVDVNLSRSIVWTPEGYFFVPVLGPVKVS